MGSYINFKNSGEPPHNQFTVSNPSISIPLARQSSIFELTFDELQNTLGGTGRDFGSMNMDEFLKNIWTAEETQTMATSAAAGNLQRQGSLALPQMLSQKTVDEVWREMFKENSGGKDVNLPDFQQQQRHGRHWELPTSRPGPEQRQPTLGEVTLEEFLSRAGVVREDTQENNIMENNFPMNMGGIRPSQQLGSIGTRCPIVGISDSGVENGVFQGGALGLGALSPDGDTSARGRNRVSLEKATERRHKRMIKNRESAERSRARKQAYNFELEAEVAKLKKVNVELLKKQDEIIDMQKNQVPGARKMPWGSKRRSLRRTVTGPW